MKIFIDSDVILDVLLNRAPFSQSSGRILNWAETHPGSCAVSWHSLANIHYLSKHGAEDFIRELLVFCILPSVGSDDMTYALDLNFKDLEDAMQVSTAMRFEAQHICTRNTEDYKRSPVSALDPQKLFPLLPQ